MNNADAAVCRSKVRYETAPAAWRAVKALRDRKHRTARVYKCRVCHLYHVTTQKDVTA